jgi:hypothetical protein
MTTRGVTRSLRLSGFPAWLIWLTVHLWYLVGFPEPTSFCHPVVFELCYPGRRRRSEIFAGEHRDGEREDHGEVAERPDGNLPAVHVAAAEGAELEKEPSQAGRPA